MIAAWLWGMAIGATPVLEPRVLAVDAPAIAGRLTSKDPRDAEGRPFDAYVVDAPPGVWVEVTVTGAAFPVRLRVGDAVRGFGLSQAGLAVAQGWSGAGGPLPIEVGVAEDGGEITPYAVTVTLVRPRVGEPPPGDLPPYVPIEASSWVVDGWYCDLRALAVPEPTVLTVWATAQDAARLRLFSGRWGEGAVRVDHWGEVGASRSGPLDLDLPADDPQVFGVCRDRLGTAYLDVRRAGDDVAPGTVIDPSRVAVTLDEAAASVRADLEGRYEVVTVHEGEASTHAPLVVPVFLQSGLSYEVVALSPDDERPATAQLAFLSCDAACEGFVATIGPSAVDGRYRVVELSALDEKQAFRPVHTERWRLGWPEGTTLTAYVRVYARSVGAQPLRVVVAEE